MKGLGVLACVLFLADACFAAAITSNGTGGGEWSKPETWAGKAVPADGDSVTIVAGDIVTFDVDMSAWTNGIAGLTCDGTMNGSTSAGTYCLKTSADIGGAGAINCGSPETEYPIDCTMTFDFDGKANSFECRSGLTLNLHCTQPAHPVVALSEAEAAGQTGLSVDTDVTGDVWIPGQTVRIDAVSASVPDSEPHVIASGGITASTITVDTGLTGAKAAGANVVLISRNIRIVGSTDYAVKSMTGGVLGCEISRCTRGVASGSGSVISGTISGCSYGVSSSSGGTVSGTISGCNYGVSSHSGGTISGVISGCYYGVSAQSGGAISGTISGCASALTDGSGCVISGVISGCTNGVYYTSGSMISGVISDCTNGVYGGSNTILEATFSDNTCDLRRVVSVSAYNTLFGGEVENYEHDTDRVPPWSYVASYRHNKVPDAFKAWTQGGVVVSDVNTVPTGYRTSYRHICASSAAPCFRQELITVEPGQALWLRAKILILDDHTAWPPRLEIVDVQADPLVDASNAALASSAIPSPQGRYYWQDVSVGYTNTGTENRQVWMRCLAGQAGCEIYEVWHKSLQ